MKAVLGIAFLFALLAAGCGRGQTPGTDGAAVPPPASDSARVAAAAESSLAAAPDSLAVPAIAETLDVSILPADTRRVSLEVGGMVCPACIQLVGRELQAVPGVRGVSGRLASQSFDVACGPEVADTSLTAAVRRAGSHYLGMIVTP